MTTNVKNNNSSSFSLKEVEHKTTSSSTTALSPAVHQISTICSVSDRKSIILEQDNSHIVKIQLTENPNNNHNHNHINNNNNNSTNFRQIFNNNTQKNSSKVSYVSIGAGKQTVQQNATKSSTSPLVTSLLMNKAKSTLTSFIKLDSNKENYANKISNNNINNNNNNSVININSNNSSEINNHSEIIKSNEMVQKSNQTNSDLEVNAPYYYYMMPSGQCSPSDTLDSGTCSDLEVTPPPVPKKMSPQTKYLNVHSNNSSEPKSTHKML